MKVIQLTNVVAPDKLGGLERYVRELSSELARLGHEVVLLGKRILPASPSSEVAADGVRIRRTPSPSKSRRTFALEYPFVITWGTVRALRREASRADIKAGRVVVHVHFPVPALAVMALGLPYVYTFHAPVYKEIAGERQGSYRLSHLAERAAIAGMKLAERLVLSRASAIITLSRFTAREALDLGARPDKISTVPGGLDIGLLRERSGPPRADFHAASDGVRVFTARRLVERTGVERLVESMSLVKERFPQVQLRIAGTGPREVAVRQLIDKLGLADTVTLLGRVSDEVLATEYQLADLSVTPTAYLEGFGLATAESLAVGTPALVTPVGANPELVEGLSAQLVCEGNDAHSIARGIVRLLDAPQELRSIRMKLQQGYADVWAWPGVASEVLAIYRTVTAANS